MSFQNPVEIKQLLFLSLSFTCFFTEPEEAGKTGWNLMIQNHRNFSLSLHGHERFTDKPENDFLIYEIMSYSFWFLESIPMYVLGYGWILWTNKKLSRHQLSVLQFNF